MRVVKVTKDRVYFAWHWECLRCGAEHSKQIKRCLCSKKKDIRVLNAKV